jgi:hypothetical protein
VDPDRTTEPDLDAIAADLAAIETALAQLEDGTYVDDAGDLPAPVTAGPEIAIGTEPDPA